MTVVEILILIAVAAVCGALAQVIAGYSRGGFIVAIVLGFIGALIGWWLARALKLPELFTLQVGTVAFPIIWSIIGGTLFVAMIALLTRRRYYY
jgi:uncharacterized membrane protein YeaQ/YmgE (transglycosylase-associated protein family)